jgi:hypothetical protein
MPTTKKKFVIVRAAQAGCFFGEIESRPSETSVILKNARRLWYWSGAASLSQMAQEGVSDPRNCKFPPSVDRQEVIGICEILDATEACITSILGVPAWRA